MRTIKKYSNRRLYDTQTKGYINLEQLAMLIRDGETVNVVDAKSGEDLTRSVLLQVILEVQGAVDMLPPALLHRMIRATVDTPYHRMALKQLGAALAILDQQLSTLETQLGFGPPKSRPAASKDAPPPFQHEASEDAAPQHADDPELDALRARLAKLEARLKS